MTQKFIFEQKNLTFNAIKNAGGNKVAIICSGNRENHGLFKMIYTTTLTYHWNHVSSVYVHLITNIRKNWTTNNCMELDFHADGERGGTKTATWYIAQFWSQSNCEIIKAYRSVCLPQAYLSIERQRVSTCLQVFCDKTLSTWKVYPRLEYNDWMPNLLKFGKL